MLILDVKGNFYKEVLSYAKSCNREDDIIVISLNADITYNPLDKPELKPLVLANRLKTILTLFSPNTGADSYWIDKAEQVIAECIKLCRLYNNSYVNFLEIHKLISYEDYYKEKLHVLQKMFRSGTLSEENIYNLSSSLEFFEKEFNSLDSRVLSILKSEITRITSVFVSDYESLKIFSPESRNFSKSLNFSDVLDSGKIAVLNLNISKYKNLSKIIAAYLKLDFQGEVLARLSTGSITPSCFISDEYHEYVTSTDADFFAQSREAKCINIVATQSYTSLLNTLKDQSCVKVITQNLINKFWFRSDDSFTIEEAQKQIGKEDKIKTSKSISENSKETKFSYLTNSLKSINSSLSESISTYVHTDFTYDTKFFTQELETFSCLCFISDGEKISPPSKIKLIPSFLKGDQS